LSPLCYWSYNNLQSVEMNFLYSTFTVCQKLSAICLKLQHLNHELMLYISWFQFISSKVLTPWRIWNLWIFIPLQLALPNIFHTFCHNKSRYRVQFWKRVSQGNEKIVYTMVLLLNQLIMPKTISSIIFRLVLGHSTCLNL
jgi:hypothetical protein